MKSFSWRGWVVIHDLSMAVAAFGLAYLVRFNFSVTASDVHYIVNLIPILVVAQGMVFWWSRLYRGVWRFASIPDLSNIIRASLIGALAVALCLFLFNRLEGVPRATLVLYPIFLTFFLGTPRLAYRLWKDQRLQVFQSEGRKRVLILGAGRAGEMLARDMVRDLDYFPVAFLDDSARLRGGKIHGIPVIGGIDRLSEIMREMDIHVVVIAVPSATADQLRRIVGLCEQANVTFRILPRLQDMMSGRGLVSDLREVSIEDLLGRDSVTLEWERIQNGLTGKKVLVSGGGGSIGSELCRQIARLEPAELVVFDHSEYGLYKIECELRRTCPKLNLRARLGSVTDKIAVEHLFANSKPDVVFHAAAYKHVPMLESQVREAVRNNVLGTMTLALAAAEHGVKKFVMISTDKAVNPANIMGATKRVAEIFCQNLNQRWKTDYITVRFGNVLGSTGSVVPLFKQQIEAGGPITVTHPDITRYFMTIPEASQLIMQGAVMGDGGEIFVLDMGEPIKISYLAEQMIRLSGKVPGKDIEIVFTGLRPGEKLYEELFHEQEPLAPTTHSKIMLARCRQVDWDALTAVLGDMETACNEFNEDSLKRLIADLVPEFSGANNADSNIVAFVRLKTDAVTTVN